jgi:hypothetical protein
MRKLRSVAKRLPHVVELDKRKVGLDLLDRPSRCERLKK